MESSPHQIILVDKPAGISSFGIVARVRGRLKAQYGRKIKVGHTGTLDPFATGLLILLTGKMTKKSNEFLKKDKVYEATLKLGYTSTTGDPEGQITDYSKSKKITEIEERGYSEFKNTSPEGFRRSRPRCEGFEPRNDGREEPRPEGECILKLLQEYFTGEITQKVPAYSAIKINGQRAYKLARAGKSFDTPTRQVTIYSIDILDYHYPELKIRVHCSSGTYIRTLAEDIGKALGTGAYLTALRRTKIADYSVTNARPLSDFASE